MGRQISKEEILNACIEGIENSFFEYLDWSGDEWLWRAPEYLLTVNIAKELNKIKKSKFITLEDSVRKTLKEYGEMKGQLPKGVRPQGRFDIVLWWANGSPRGIIEVKNAVFQKKEIDEDLKRIYNILNKDSTLEFGVTTFYMDRHYETKDPVETLEKRIVSEFINKIKQDIENKYRFDYVYQEINSEKKDSAFAVAIMIYK